MDPVQKSQSTSERVARWRQAATDAIAKPVLTVAEKVELGKLRAQDRRRIKEFKEELFREDRCRASV
jgi:hypothetical protein